MPAFVCDLYLKARDRVRERKQAKEHEIEMQRLEERLHRELASQITPVQRLIIDTVLTLSCPLCRAAFLDYNGCMALTCSRPGCNCKFCAICLKDCGADAHGHVAACKYNSARNLFASAESWKEMQNAWRTARIKEVGSQHALNVVRMAPCHEPASCSLTHFLFFLSFCVVYMLVIVVVHSVLGHHLVRIWRHVISGIAIRGVE